MKFSKLGLTIVWLSLVASPALLAKTASSTALSLGDPLDSTVVATTLNQSAHALQISSIESLLPQQIFPHALAYTPSLELRKANLNRFALQRQQQNLTGPKDLEALLNSTEVIEAIQKTIEPYGLTINNIADVYTLWWITAWQASEGSLTKVDKVTAQAVKQQAAKIWLANPKLMEATDANKQEIAEALLVQSLLIQTAINLAGDNELSQKAVMESVRKGAAASGLALQNMQLTSEGFIARP